MAYCEIEEIEADFKDITFSDSSNISADDVTGFITEADALINSYVGARYVVPLVSGDGLNLLKFYSRSIVAGRIKKILEVKQEKSVDANQSVQGVFLSLPTIMKALADIRDNKTNLDGAQDLFTDNGFFSNNYATGVRPVMRKDDKQW